MGDSVIESEIDRIFFWPAPAHPDSGKDMTKRAHSHSSLLTLAAVTLGFGGLLALAGCGVTKTAVTTPHEDSKMMPAALAEAEEAVASAPAKVAEPDAQFATRDVGDYVVYKFSGAFRKTPALLTEKVIAREGGLFVIDYTFGDSKDAKNASTLRVHLNAGAGASVTVLEVEKMVNGNPQPALPSDFDALMAKTILTVDDNEAMTSTEETTLQIGGAELACEKTTYRVRVGKDEATMIVTQSKGFAWGDVAAEIRTKTGTMLYRAEIVDSGKGTPEAAAPLALLPY